MLVAGTTMTVPLVMANALTAQAAIPAVATIASLPDASTHSQATKVTNAQVPRDPLGTLVEIDLTNTPMHVVLDELSKKTGITIVYSRYLVPVDRKVTVRSAHATLGRVLRQVLDGTGTEARPDASGHVVIGRATDTHVQGHGIISGIVVDAQTKNPVAGANVLLDDARRGVATDESGAFKITGVDSGTHRVTVRLVGYTKHVKQVDVSDTKPVTIEVKLQKSLNTLDQVVVTGTVIATAQKAVPNAMTVITARDIEQRGITRIDQLFRGDIPGLFVTNIGESTLDQVSMFSRGASSLSGDDLLGAQSNPIKTYVDGVELANPRFLSQIDPRSIERIEILAGPQASTIYGSNAINGVMQIFTKRGSSASRPQFTASLISGEIQNNYSPKLTPEHDYSGQVSGVEGHWSYNAGLSWLYVGRWTPSQQKARYDGFAGGRMQMGPLTTDLSLRRGLTQNRLRGGTDGVLIYASYLGNIDFNLRDNGLRPAYDFTLNGQTVGLTMTYAPTSWWSHEFGIGNDVSETEQVATKPGYSYAGNDTSGYYVENQTSKTSERYATTAHFPIGTAANATITVGGDHWSDTYVAVQGSGTVLTGTLADPNIQRDKPGRNTGGFVQSQVGLFDALFFTYGLRAEWNPNYGANEQPSLAPRYGVAYSQEIGIITAKIRASYGRATRPPRNDQKKSVSTATDPYNASYYRQYFGDFDSQIANPNLGPEYQQGGEGGIELYLGGAGSLTITRYNQTVNRLISSPTVDSVRSLIPDPFGYCSSSPSSCGVGGYVYSYQIQNLNIGNIRNQGWELQGTITTGPVTTKGTYSWTKSRVLGIDAQYRHLFPASSYPQYQPGASFQYLPEHTWATSVTYAHAGTTVGVNFNGTGFLYNSGDELYYSTYYGRLMSVKGRATGLPGYQSRANGYLMADLNASHRLNHAVEGVVSIQNLTNKYRSDYDSIHGTMGRQSKLGVRVRL